MNGWYELIKYIFKIDKLKIFYGFINENLSNKGG